jgi:hypothetical protein
MRLARANSDRTGPVLLTFLGDFRRVLFAIGRRRRWGEVERPVDKYSSRDLPLLSFTRRNNRLFNSALAALTSSTVGGGAES